MKAIAVAAASLLALAAGAARAAEPSIKDYPDVTDTSFVEANGDKVLQLSIVIPAARQAVWEQVTTTAGYVRWATPMARIDFGLGGMIEASYDSHAKIGDPDNIKNRIVAYVPGRWMAIQNAQAPADLPNRDAFREIVTMMEFEDSGTGATKVTLTAVGYRPTPAFDDLYTHFGWGDAYTLAKLKLSFTKGPIDWKAAEARAQAQAAADKVQGKK
ncbi:MAG: SRPBCC domain-containing protein [Caulobacterales bacterium]|nr:SRPBCC domain-containing protein [Caulobacterales bacterium]